MEWRNRGTEEHVTCYTSQPPTPNPQPPSHIIQRYIQLIIINITHHPSPIVQRYIQLIIINIARHTSHVTRHTSPIVQRYIQLIITQRGVSQEEQGAVFCNGHFSRVRVADLAVKTRLIKPKTKTLNPKPKTQNPKPKTQTPNPKPQTCCLRRLRVRCRGARCCCRNPCESIREKRL